MTFRLHKDEHVVATVDFHWITYFWSGLWLSFTLLALISSLLENKQQTTSQQNSHVLMLIIGVLPIAIRFLSNKCKKYIITNQRFYIEEGILAKSRREIPISKINNIDSSQGFLQRLVGAGNVYIYAGNDKALTIKSVAESEIFAEKMSYMLGQREDKAS